MINNMELKKKAAIAIKKNYCKCIFVPVLFILCLWLNNRDCEKKSVNKILL